MTTTIKTERMIITVSNEMKSLMLAMRVCGLLDPGEDEELCDCPSAYQRMIKLSPRSLDTVAAFCKFVADSKRMALDINGACPDCEGTNLNEDKTRCWDCDPEASW
jgi:hypothetical protein